MQQHDSVYSVLLFALPSINASNRSRSSIFLVDIPGLVLVERRNGDEKTGTSTRGLVNSLLFAPLELERARRRQENGTCYDRGSPLFLLITAFSMSLFADCDRPSIFCRRGVGVLGALPAGKYYQRLRVSNFDLA